MELDGELEGKEKSKSQTPQYNQMEVIKQPT